VSGKHLIVKLDRVATVREAGGGSDPDPVAASVLALLGGADGISVHLREDRRDVQDRDARLVRQVVPRDFSLEMAPSQEMLKIALELRPDSAVLVAERGSGPEGSGVLDIVSQLGALGEIVRALEDGHVRSVVLIQADLDQVKAAHRIGVGAVRFHTGRFVEGGPDQSSERAAIVDAARLARKLGLRVGVGGGLDGRSVRGLVDLDDLSEFAVGHAIAARAMLVGMERAVREMRDLVP
jgi:pyridoxine 5-phosphate synthase